MKNDIILLDVDDVLLDWFSGFERYMVHLGYGPEESHDQWDLDKVFNFPKKEKTSLISNFNTSWEFGTLAPLPGAKKGLNRLKKEGFRFVAITSCSTNPTTISLRKTNLFWCFGDVFEAVHCLNLGESKETHLADYRPTWWVEDKFENAVAGLKFGHRSILINKAHNENEVHEDIIRVKAWNQITKLILNNDNE